MEKGSLDHVDIFPTNLFPAVHNTTLLCVLLVIIPQLVYSETLLWFRIDNCTNITHSLFLLIPKKSARSVRTACIFTLDSTNTFLPW